MKDVCCACTDLADGETCRSINPIPDLILCNDVSFSTAVAKVACQSVNLLCRWLISLVMLAYPSQDALWSIIFPECIYPGSITLMNTPIWLSFEQHSDRRSCPFVVHLAGSRALYSIVSLISMCLCMIGRTNHGHVSIVTPNLA